MQHLQKTTMINVTITCTQARCFEVIEYASGFIMSEFQKLVPVLL